MPTQQIGLQQQQPIEFSQKQPQSFFGQPQHLFPSNTGGLFGSSAGAPIAAPSASSAFRAFPTIFGGSTFGSAAPTLPALPPPAPAPLAPQDDGFSSFEEVTAPGALSEPTTIVTESPLSVSYGVEGESTIPSDGVPHQVSVAILAFDSKVTHICCPKIDPRVYLQV